ncbi:putative phosphonate catabolism associated alcohol dehydrogenase [Agromyces sp. CF514]|uniref:zinc-binding dehydrogenase n=1 Tax=Agromyces sp. CF514 TaxID=1881031 RepID=UPI0008E5FB30|nr:zinc-binding dehydrogenase [Agromyces sp. CF514]SFR91849.1 putative phosphonate catabolism associated alcohol dehydrogenase [Agromyces sp. CF514]
MTLVRAEAGAVLVKPSPTAMVWHEVGRPHESIAVPGLELREGEALVEVELATICGSDVHTVLGHRRSPAPSVLGHEQVGHVVALGPGGAATVDGTPLALGDRIVWSVTASCGHCERCLRGLSQKCLALRKYGHERLERGWELSGGFATHVHLRAGTAIVRVPEHLAAELAAPAACSTATAVAAVEAGAAQFGTRAPGPGGTSTTGTSPADPGGEPRGEPLGVTVLISGAGMIGIAATAIVSEAGATVVVVDPDPARRATALRFGADVVLDPGEGPLAAQLAALAAPAPLVAIEASGAVSSVRSVIDACAVGGTVVLVGSVSPGPAVELDPEQVVRRLLTITGVHNYAPRHLQRAIGFLSGSPGTFGRDHLVGARFALDDLDTAIEVAASGAHVRVAIDPRAVRPHDTVEG